MCTVWINVTLEPTDYAHVDNLHIKALPDLSTNPQYLLLLLLYLTINIYNKESLSYENQH